MKMEEGETNYLRIGFLTIANSGWAHAIGVACLLAFVALGYRAALPPDPAADLRGQ